MNPLLVMCLATLLVSCANLSPASWGASEWKGTGTAGVATASLASLDWSKLPGVIAAIDGTKVGTGYNQAQLAPGRHVIEYAYHTAEFGAHPQGKFGIDLHAGHAYEFNIKLCFWCSPRKSAVWVDDLTSNTLVWGKRPDWPAWYL